MLSSIEELIDILEKSGQHLVSAPEWEVKEIENRVSLPLPLVYRQFLLNMGKGTGVFMQGSSVFVNEVAELQSWGNELLHENGMEALPEDAFVFWMHQGYQMAYFILGESENPTVYYFSEGKDLKSFEKIDSLLEFFFIQLRFSGLA